MENAIDANATKIFVTIKDAGKTLIQIIDNGKGMNEEDAELCFLRHATSKIHKADDLFALHTKGFRGEALASIAAIAHVSLSTKQDGKETGVKVLIEGSNILEKEEVVRDKGTCFEVKNLFYNVPARRNFLKSNDIEFKHIKEEFERLTLAHPDIEFQLIHNGSEVFNLKSTVLRKRIIDIIGDKQNERLVPIDEKTSIVTITGFVLKPEFAKKTRGEQYFFVNNRFFKDAYFNNAVYRAFENLIQPKTYPGYFLYFEIDPSKIDVNVHPTKTEIKFEEDKFIYSILVSSIRQALGRYNITPTLDFEREQSFDIPYEMQSKPAIEPNIKINPNYNPFTVESKTSKGNANSSSNTALNKHGFGTNKSSQQDWESFYNIDEVEEKKETQQSELDLEESHIGSGQLIIKSPFIFFPSKTGLMVVHGKRAYERITYDEMMKEFVIRPIVSQTLLFPYEKEISSGEKEIWESNLTLLNRLGFESKIEKDTLFIDAVPAVLENEVINDCVDSIIGNLSFVDIDKGEVAHILISNIAKNAAIAKTINSTKKSVDHLIESLFQCEQHVYTPNGKLILKSIPLTDIHNLF